MATRATYQINDTNKDQCKTFYIHWDGYPEGGAAYLYRMLNSEPAFTGFPRLSLWQIIGQRSEGHDAHGDTEYQYTVNVMPHTIHLTVYARDMEHYPVGGWKLHYSGAMTDFIRQHASNPLFQNLSTVGATKSEVAS